MHGPSEVKIEMDMAAPDAERVLGKKFDVEMIAPDVIFGEGPVWDKRTKALYFIDICGDTIWKWKPGGKHEADHEALEAGERHGDRQGRPARRRGLGRAHGVPHRRGRPQPRRRS